MNNRWREIPIRQTTRARAHNLPEHFNNYGGITMTKLYYLLIAALVGSTLSLVGTSPAQAVTDVDVQANNVRLRADDCRAVPIRVSGDWTDGEIDVTVTNPAGSQVAQEHFSDATGLVVSSYTVCGRSARGWYTVTADVVDGDTTTASGSDTFSHTRVVPAKKVSKVDRTVRWKKAKHQWLAIGRLTRAGHGYTGKPVEIQARIQGTWMKIASTRTIRNGKFGWWIKPSRFTWRYVYQGDATTRGDVSPTFRTPHRGKVLVRAGADPSSFLVRR